MARSGGLCRPEGPTLQPCNARKGLDQLIDRTLERAREQKTREARKNLTTLKNSRLGVYPVRSDGKGLLPIANAYTNDAYAKDARSRQNL